MVVQQKDRQEEDNHQGAFHTGTAASRDKQVAIDNGVSITPPPFPLTRSGPATGIGPMHYGSLDHPLIERPLDETQPGMSSPANHDDGDEPDTHTASTSFPAFTPCPSFDQILPPPSPLTTSGPADRADHMEPLGPAVVGNLTVDIGGHLSDGQVNEIHSLTSQINDNNRDCTMNTDPPMTTCSLTSLTPLHDTVIETHVDEVPSGSFAVNNEDEDCHMDTDAIVASSSAEVKADMVRSKIVNAIQTVCRSSRNLDRGVYRGGGTSEGDPIDLTARRSRCINGKIIEVIDLSNDLVCAFLQCSKCGYIPPTRLRFYRFHCTTQRSNAQRLHTPGPMCCTMLSGLHTLIHQLFM